MRMVFKYIFGQITKMLLLVLAIIAVLELFILLVTESGNIGNGGYDLHAMLIYVL